jgi:hypothetical protein
MPILMSMPADAEAQQIFEKIYASARESESRIMRGNADAEVMI